MNNNSKIKRLHKRNNKRWLRDIFALERFQHLVSTPIMYKKDDVVTIIPPPVKRPILRHLNELKHPYKMSRTKQKKLFLKINQMEKKTISFRYEDRITHKWSFFGYVVEKLGKTVTE